MKLHSLFALVAMTAALAACGGGGGDSPAPAPSTAPTGTPAPAPAASSVTYTFASATNPNVTFTVGTPASVTVAAGEKFKITNNLGELGGSKTSSISGTCAISVSSLGGALYEAALAEAPCVKKFAFTSNGATGPAEITVTAK